MNFFAHSTFSQLESIASGGRWTPDKATDVPNGRGEASPAGFDRKTTSKPLPGCSFVPGKVPRRGAVHKGEGSRNRPEQPEGPWCGRGFTALVEYLPPRRSRREAWRRPCASEAVGLRPGLLLPLRRGASRLVPNRNSIGMPVTTPIAKFRAEIRPQNRAASLYDSSRRRRASDLNSTKSSARPIVS